MSKLKVKESAAGPSQAEWVTKMSLLGQMDRKAYRMLRALAWAYVVENSGRSDFPSKMS